MVPNNVEKGVCIMQECEYGEWKDVPMVEHNSFFIMPKPRNGLALLKCQQKLDGYYAHIRIPSGGLREVWSPYRTTGESVP